MNEVRILVRTQNSTKTGFEAVDREVDAFAKKSSETFAKHFSENLSRTLAENVTAKLRDVGRQAEAGARNAGDAIGETIGRRASERITTRITDRLRTVFRGGGSSSSSSDSSSSARSGGLTDGGNDRQRVSVDVDIDKKSLLQRLSDFGKEAGNRFSDGFKTTFSSIFSGDVISTIVKGAGLVALGNAIAVPLAAAITSGVLLAVGGGVLAAGVAAAFQDPIVKSAFDEFKTNAKSALAEFGKPFRTPVLEFLTRLAAMARNATPWLKRLGEEFAPIADLFGDKLLESIEKFTPGFKNALAASEPLLKTLAENLPNIADAMSDFLTSISEQGDDANLFFSDLLKGTAFLIRFLGRLIAIFTSAYDKIHTFGVGVRELFENVKIGAMVTSTYVAEVFITLARMIADIIEPVAPKIAASLRRGANAAEGFQKDINEELAKIRDKTVTLRFRVLGQAAANAAVRTARILAGMAHGGIKGAASGGERDGLTWVGEQGPELVQLPTGSRVNTAGDSQRMAAQAGGMRNRSDELRMRLTVDRTTERGVIDALFKMFRIEIDRSYGGDVQLALGN